MPKSLKPTPLVISYHKSSSASKKQNKIIHTWESLSPLLGSTLKKSKTCPKKKKAKALITLSSFSTTRALKSRNWSNSASKCSEGRQLPRQRIWRRRLPLQQLRNGKVLWKNWIYDLNSSVFPFGFAATLVLVFVRSNYVGVSVSERETLSSREGTLGLRF